MIRDGGIRGARPTAGQQFPGAVAGLYLGASWADRPTANLVQYTVFALNSDVTTMWTWTMETGWILFILLAVPTFADLPDQSQWANGEGTVTRVVETGAYYRWTDSAWAEL